MSDEDDQSPEDLSVLRDFFLSLKPSPDLVAVNAIAGPVDTPCATGSQPGHRYFWMAEETGGLFFDICLPDWEPLLGSLNLDESHPVDRWRLSQAPVLETLVVRVDGVEILEDGVGGYTYVPPTNMIRFYGAAVPPFGATITSEYEPACL